MPIAKETSGDYMPAPQGTHVARCISVVSLGTQPADIYPSAFKVRLAWELPEYTIEREKGITTPMVISKFYKLSLHKKATLRQHLEAWRGRAFTKEELQGFEVGNVLNVPCLITITHKDGEDGPKASIAGVSALPRGMSVPDAYHVPARFETSDGKNDVFKQLPEKLQKIIEQCEEWQTEFKDGKQQMAGGIENADNDPIPF